MLDASSKPSLLALALELAGVCDSARRASFSPGPMACHSSGATAGSFAGSLAGSFVGSFAVSFAGSFAGSSGAASLRGVAAASGSEVSSGFAGTAVASGGDVSSPPDDAAPSAPEDASCAATAARRAISNRSAKRILTGGWIF